RHEISEGYDFKSGIIGDRYRWPNNTVPLTFSSTFSKKSSHTFSFNFLDLLTVNLVLSPEISEKTCIQFVYRSNERDYVSVVRGEQNSGCWSDVGKIGGEQVLNLNPPGRKSGCIIHGIVIHEMMHALGFHHEQSRTDRDDYVTIFWDNIIPGEKHNFDKYSRSEVDSQGLAYDYGSIMHYPTNMFALDTSRPTILPKRNVKIGQRKRLSATDTQRLRNMYRC
ncbi:High choriolytic enzyme 1, partial [Orchesella cincta]